MIEDNDSLLIPVSDRKFIIQPDNRELEFENTGVLHAYLDKQIIAWSKTLGAVHRRYILAKNALNKICSESNGSIKPGALDPVKRELKGYALRGYEIEACIDIESELGQYILERRQHFKNNDNAFINSACAAFALVFDIVNLPNISAIWLLEAARASAVLLHPKSTLKVTQDCKVKLEKIASLYITQEADFANRIAEFERCKNAFNDTRKEQLKSDKSAFELVIKELKDTADKHEQEYQLRIKELEATYEEKLRLEGPAQYWESLAKSYLNKGWVFFVLAFVLGAVVFAWLLALLMDCSLFSFFEHKKFDAATIRASLVFLVMTSVAGYLLHLFTRLSVSSFHLARDYKERFQLTRVYLALIKDYNLQSDEAFRKIVMQSIFSRSDTGLLKGDHQIVMPGTMLTDVGKQS